MSPVPGNSESPLKRFGTTPKWLRDASGDIVWVEVGWWLVGVESYPNKINRCQHGDVEQKVNHYGVWGYQALWTGWLLYG